MKIFGEKKATQLTINSQSAAVKDRLKAGFSGFLTQAEKDSRRAQLESLSKTPSRAPNTPTESEVECEEVEEVLDDCRRSPVPHIPSRSPTPLVHQPLSVPPQASVPPQVFVPNTMQQSVVQPQVSQAPDRNSINLFGKEVEGADVARLIVATAPILSPDQMRYNADQIKQAKLEGRDVQVATVWRSVEQLAGAMPSPFQLSRGDAIIDGDGDLSVRYWKGRGNGDDVAGKTFKLPYQEPGVIEYSFVGFIVLPILRQSVAPAVMQRPGLSLAIPPKMQQRVEEDEDEEDQRPKKMERLYRGPGTTSFDVHDAPSIALFMADLMRHGTAPTVIAATTMAEIDRQVGRPRVRFTNTSMDAACAALNGAILACIEDEFESHQVAANLKHSINVYRLAVASAVFGTKRVDQAIQRNAVNVPKDDVMGRALASIRGRGRGRGRGGRGGGTACSHCGKYGHTVDNCYQKQGQGNVSRGEAGKATRQ